MTISSVHATKTFVDILGNNDTNITVDETCGEIFPVNSGEVSVYVNEEILEKLLV